MDLLFFIISEIVKILILPPGVIIVLLLLASVVSRRFKLLFLFASIIFYVTSIRYFGQFLNANISQNDIIFQKCDKYDAVVVLGYGVDEESPSFKLMPHVLKSLLYGYVLAKEGDVPLLFSGAGLDTLKEYEAADLTLERLRLDTNRVYYEKQSLNTYQNAKFSYEILKKLPSNIKSIALVSSASHLVRAIEIFKNQTKYDICPKPYDKERIKGIYIKKEYGLIDFYPRMDALFENYNKIHEILGEIKEKIRRLIRF